MRERGTQNALPGSSRTVLPHRKPAEVQRVSSGTSHNLAREFAGYFEKQLGHTGEDQLSTLWRETLFVLALLFGTAEALPSHAQISQGDGDLRVMTYNIYQGTNHTEVLAAATKGQAAFFTAVGQTITQVRATKPPERMRAVAQEIAAAVPDLVSLQEVNTWLTGPFSLSTFACGSMTIEFDMLRDLLNALVAQGAFYEVAVQAQQFTVPPIPGFFPPSICVQEANRVVILARADLDPSKFRVTGAHSGHYQNFFSASTPFGPVPDRRAWVSVDAESHGKPFRFIGTHLDSTDPDIQAKQAAELRDGPANTTLPVILAMDSNSRAAPAPLDQIYVDFIRAGWQDAWTKTNRNNLGLTCCQGQLVNNAATQLSQRIDLILTFGKVVAQNIAVFGDNQDSKTGEGLWPSDHAGVAAQLLVQSARTE